MALWRVQAQEMYFGDITRLLRRCQRCRTGPFVNCFVRTQVQSDGLYHLVDDLQDKSVFSMSQRQYNEVQLTCLPGSSCLGVQ